MIIVYYRLPYRAENVRPKFPVEKKKKILGTSGAHVILNPPFTNISSSKGCYKDEITSNLLMDVSGQIQKAHSMCHCNIENTSHVCFGLLQRGRGDVGALHHFGTTS